MLFSNCHLIIVIGKYQMPIKYFIIQNLSEQAGTLLFRLVDFLCDDKVVVTVTWMVRTVFRRDGRPFLLPPVLRLLHHHPLERAVGEKGHSSSRSVSPPDDSEPSFCAVSSSGASGSSFDSDSSSPSSV